MRKQMLASVLVLAALPLMADMKARFLERKPSTIEGPWRDKDLDKAPAAHPAPEMETNGVTAVFLDSLLKSAALVKNSHYSVSRHLDHGHTPGFLQPEIAEFAAAINAGKPYPVNYPEPFAAGK